MYAICSFYASSFLTKIEGRPFFLFRFFFSPFSCPDFKLYAKNILLPERRFQKRGYPCLPDIFSMRLRGLANLDVDLMPK